jgi:hypothetical protein
MPAWALSVARAKKATLLVDAATFDVSPQNLRDYRAFYRVAVCDTLPAH